RAGRERPSTGLANVGRLRPLGAFGHLVLHLLPFGEASETLRLNRGVVDEHVLPASVGGDEAEALRIVEPLHRTGRHRSTPGGKVAAGLIMQDTRAPRPR